MKKVGGGGGGIKNRLKKKKANKKSKLIKINKNLQLKKIIIIAYSLIFWNALAFIEQIGYSSP